MEAWAVELRIKGSPDWTLEDATREALFFERIFNRTVATELVSHEVYSYDTGEKNAGS